MNRPANFTITQNMKKLVNVLHSYLFEQMADLEALHTASNETADLEVTKQKLYEDYQNLFRPYISSLPSLNDAAPHQVNSSWNDYDFYSNYIDYDIDSAATNSTRIRDVLGSENWSGHGEVDECHRISIEEANSYAEIAFRMELIAQPIFATIGFGFNSIAISILRSGHPHLSNIFNGLLIWLAFFDNCFMLFNIIENFRRHLDTSWIFGAYIFDVFGVFVLYPLKIIALACITNTQVALAIERFRAIKHPIEYHRHNASKESRYKLVKGYVSKAVIVAFIFCMPKFFESRVAHKMREDNVTDPVTNITTMKNVTSVEVEFADMRFNKYYVLVYNIVIRQLSTALVPFIILVMFNISTFVIIHRRQRLSPRLQNRRSQAINEQAARQSYVLLAIFIVYGLCHIPSFMLVLHEFANLELIQSSLTSGCHVIEFWTLVAGTISQTLLTLNSSINFLMYPAISKDFRSVFKQYFKLKMRWTTKLWQCRREDANHDTNDAEAQPLQTSTQTFEQEVAEMSMQIAEGLNNESIMLPEIQNQQNANTPCDASRNQTNTTISSTIPNRKRSCCKIICDVFNCNSNSSETSENAPEGEVMAISMAGVRNSANDTVEHNSRQLIRESHGRFNFGLFLPFRLISSLFRKREKPAESGNATNGAVEATGDVNKINSSNSENSAAEV